MDQKTIKNFTSIAAFCFAIMTIMTVFNAIRYPNLTIWLYAIGYIFVVIALVASVPALSAVGFAIRIIPVILPLFQSDFSGLFHFGMLYGISCILDVILRLSMYILLVFVSIKRTHAKMLGISAAALHLVSTLNSMLHNMILAGSTGYSSILSFVSPLLFVVSVVCLGIAYQHPSKNS